MSRFYSLAIIILLVTSCNEECEPPPCPPYYAGDARVKVYFDDSFSEHDLNNMVIELVHVAPDTVFNSYPMNYEGAKQGISLGANALTFFSGTKGSYFPETDLSIRFVIGENRECIYLFENPLYEIRPSEECTCPQYLIKNITADGLLVEFDFANYDPTITLEK